MKLSLIYRVTLGAMFAIILPFTLLASSDLYIDKPVKMEWRASNLPVFQDSTAARKKTSKPQDNQKPSRSEQEEKLKDAQRRAIKEVPRSIPKLKPKAVTERIKILRPTIKVRGN